MNKINELYKMWESDPSQCNLGNLLEAVRKRIVSKYQRIDINAEDIAQDTIIKLMRSLPGYTGNDPLKLYQDRGKFAAYVITVAHNTRADIIKLTHETPVSDDVLERLLNEESESYDSDDGYSL